MGLRQCDIGDAYRTDTHNIVSDFYLPCLAQSVDYSRAVGFFTSGSLGVAAKGVTALIERGGSMRLVASPILDGDDIEAIRRGYALRDDVVAGKLLQELDSVRGGSVVQERLGFLAWLVAEGNLDVKIAVGLEKELGGNYHEKIGLFRDELGDQVAFIGSPNESANGLVGNFESVEVFASWRPGEEERVARLAANFERLWGDKTRTLEVVEFPEAARRRLLKHRPPMKPTTDPEQRGGRAAPVRHTVNAALRPVQDEAVRRWLHRGARGILSMATGSGKTLAALACTTGIERLGVVAIAAPTIEITRQWSSVIQKRTSLGCPTMAMGSSSDWHERAYRKLRLLSAGALEYPDLPFVVAGTYASLSSERFRELVDDAGGMPAESMIVCDEVHQAGAPSYSRVLRADFKYRLGLSATPVRPHDEEGTALLLDYFGGTAFTYSISQAIADGYLCPYDYFVEFAELSRRETEEYDELTQQINKLSHTDDEEMKELVDRLRIRRADVVKQARAKIPLVTQIIEDRAPRKALFYCANIAQGNEVAALIAHAGHRVASYTSEDPHRESLLREFTLGRFDALVSVRCLDEGVDVPSAEMAVILASDSSERQFIQRRGRVLRAAAGKSHATIVDVVTVASREVSGVPIWADVRRALKFARAARNRLSALAAMGTELAPYGVTLGDLYVSEEARD